MSFLQHAAENAVSIANNPRYSRPVSYLLLVFDALLSTLVIKKIAYTEIDWEAYMQQIATYRTGERDYRNIKGGTGPLVYPAGHVYVFDLLYTLTDGGHDRWVVQCVFWGLYMATLWMVMKCYRLAKAPPWILPLLVLSRRLHSIYLLRFFNDCISTLLMFMSIYFMQKKLTTASTILYTLSVSVKMSTLLYLPAIGLVLLFLSGTKNALFMAGLMVQIQALLALPFAVGRRASLSGYVGRAFEFSREFMFKWTVNWRFVGEETFRSAQFKYTLLASHVGLLLFFLYTRWIRPSGKSLAGIASFALKFPSANDGEVLHISQRMTPQIILTTLFSCNMIGMLCARSLHYQFFSWMAWSTPFLLWRSGLGLPFVYTVWLAQEVAWNIYPSTNQSSLLAVACMVMQIVGVWIGTAGDGQEAEANKAEKAE